LALTGADGILRLVISEEVIQEFIDDRLAKVDGLHTDRVHILVSMDLDPEPGEFHSAESAVAFFQGVADMFVPHYRPHVSDASDDVEQLTHVLGSVAAVS
jgi:hypothetical protein